MYPRPICRPQINSSETHLLEKKNEKILNVLSSVSQEIAVLEVVKAACDCTSFQEESIASWEPPNKIMVVGALGKW